MTMSVTVNKEKFSILYDGKEIPMGDLVDIHNKFEILCTAEFIEENHNLNVSSEKIWELAERVRYYMDEFDYSETEAIDYILKCDGLEDLQERGNT